MGWNEKMRKENEDCASYSERDDTMIGAVLVELGVVLLGLALSGATVPDARGPRGEVALGDTTSICERGDIAGTGEVG